MKKIISSLLCGAATALGSLLMKDIYKIVSTSEKGKKIKEKLKHTLDEENAATEV